MKLLLSKKFISAIVLIAILVNSCQWVLADDTINSNKIIYEGAVKSSISFTDSNGERKVSPTSFTNDKDTNNFYPSHGGSSHGQPKEFTSFKDQGFTYSAWVFAGISAFESALIKKGYENNSIDLSEEHARQSILGNTDSDYKYQGVPYSQGNFDMLYSYMTRGYGNGVIKETSQLPYLGCSSKPNDWYKEYTLKELEKFEREPYYPTKCISLANMPSTNNVAFSEKIDRVNKIKDLVNSYGNVVATIPIEKGYLNNNVDINSYYLPDNISSEKLTTVEIIGWEDEWDREEFSPAKPKHHGAFLVKKSWKSDSNDQNMYISYDDVNKFTDLRCIADISKDYGSKTIYELDELNESGQKFFQNTNNIVVANKFKRKSETSENLINVKLTLTDTATKFKVLVSRTGEFKDFEEVELADIEKEDNGYYSFPDAGRYVVTLKKPVWLENPKFAIGIQIYNDNGALSYTYECDEVISFEDEYFTEQRVQSMESVAKANSYNGESYYGGIDGNFDDSNFTDFVKYKGGNWGIKAYTEQNGMKSADNSNISLTNPSLEIYFTPTLIKDGMAKIIANYKKMVRMSSSGLELQDEFDADTKASSLELHLKDKAEITIEGYGKSKVSLYDSKGNILDTEDFTPSSGMANTPVKRTLRYTGDEGYVYIGVSDGKLPFTIKNIDIKNLTIGDDSTVKKMWNFSDETYSGLRYIYKNTEIEGLLLEYGVSIEYDSVDSNKFFYTRSAHLLPSTSIKTGCIGFYVPHDTDIYFNASANTEGAYIKIQDKMGKVLTRKPVAYKYNNAEGNSFKYHYTGYGEMVYISSDSNEIEVYEINIDKHSSENILFNKSWNMSEIPMYDVAGKGNEEVEFGDLKLYGMDQDSRVKNIKDSVDGINYRRCYSLSTEYKKDENTPYLKINVPTNCTIKILAHQSNSKTNTMIVSDDTHQMLLDRVEIKEPQSTWYEVKFENGSGEVTIKSAKSSMYIYAIKLVNGDEDNNIGDEDYDEAYAELGVEVIDNVVSGSGVGTNEDFENKDFKENDVLADKISSEESSILDNELKTKDITEDLKNDEAIETTTDDINSFNLTEEMIENINNMSINYDNLISLTSEGDDNYKNWYYNQLTSDIERNLYNQLKEAFSDKQCTDDISYIKHYVDLDYSYESIEILKENMRNAMTAFINDYPEVFWINTNYKYKITSVSNNNQKKILEMGMYITRNSYVGDSNIIKNTYIPDLNSKIEEIVESGKNNGKTNFEKLEYIYSLIKCNSRYIQGKSKNNVYNVLCNKNGTCTGFSRSLKFICDEMGIPCVVARGTVGNSNEKHMWNIVKLNGQWFICDITNELENTSSINKFFAIADNGEYKQEIPTSYLNKTMNFRYPAVSNNEGIFNARYYADNNKDVFKLYGYDDEKLYNHYISYGLKEGRRCSPVYDPVYYYNKYADLQKVFGDDYTKLYNHFMIYGMKEGRQASDIFDIKEYKNQNSEIVGLFGDGLERYYGYFSQHSNL